MALADIPGYLGRIGCYRHMSERFLGRPPQSLAGWLVEDLARSGAIRIAGEVVFPTLAA